MFRSAFYITVADALAAGAACSLSGGGVGDIPASGDDGSSGSASADSGGGSDEGTSSDGSGSSSSGGSGSSGGSSSGSTSSSGGASSSSGSTSSSSGASDSGSTSSSSGASDSGSTSSSSGGADADAGHDAEVDSGTVDATSNDAGALSFATDVYPIITARCIACHNSPNGSGVIMGHLDLLTSVAAGAYSQLVNVRAMGNVTGTAGATCAGLTRVVPNNSGISLLFNKVSSKLMGMPAVCGNSMPAGAVPLTPAQVTTIQTWIDQGANP